jgi:hypothetical protein
MLLRSRSNTYDQAYDLHVYIPTNDLVSVVFGNLPACRFSRHSHFSSCSPSRLFLSTQFLDGSRVISILSDVEAESCIDLSIDKR